ncbi:MAG: TetR/AcrR family transcriptional regulator [Chloroflexi bacterium]|nr:MAG: TetR/AcrR family transcriptional regulator [Chloroflexota bacterium]TMD83834.1 MAG: TetR/AcrR family transcriptional regulator [Chloroflexota bacterium]
MSPRPYRLGQRQVAADETRSRILNAAREQLEKEASFSIDAVARRADVARMTVYYQFGSRRGLLEALFDDLAARGGIPQLPSAFQEPDPMLALDRLIEIFAHFWSSARVVHRRLRAIAVLDPELLQTLVDRNEWRRRGLRAILSRLARTADSQPIGEVVDLLFVLSSFESFDMLAGGDRTPDEVVPMVKQAAAAILRRSR